MKFTLSLRAQALSDLGAKLFDVGDLLLRLSSLRDRRHRKGRRYDLADVLLVIVLAKLSGQDRAEEVADWMANRQRELRELLLLPWQTRAPHANTLRRIVEDGVDPFELDRVVGEFLSETVHSGPKRSRRKVLIAIDGKTLRGTISQERPNGEHLLAAYLPDEGIVLMQVSAGGHDNEITAAPVLLKCLDLRGKVIVGDAIHTQRELSVQILEAGGDYVWVAKKNQPTLLDEIQQLFEDDWRGIADETIPNDFESYETLDKGHGRKERREITVSSELKGYLDWPGVEQVFRLKRERTDLHSNHTTTQIVYGLTSLTRREASPTMLLSICRRYWQIENGLHHRRDVTFREDHCRATRRRAGHILSSMNNLAVGILHRQRTNNIAKARRSFDAQLERLLATPPHACSLT